MSEFTPLEERIKNLTVGLLGMVDGQKILVNKAFLEHVRDDMAELLTLRRAAQPGNDPLTLEQLREMHGQPVWVVPNRGIAKWYLVDVANDCCSTCDMDVVDFELYGPKDKSYGWLAYRRKPEPEGRENDGPTI